MPKVKKTPVNKFEEYIKKAISNVEHIRTKQEEKQAVLDEYEKQHKRYADGKIAKRTYTISVKKNRALLKSIDSDIKKSITTTKGSLRNALKINTSQHPLNFNISLDGLTSPARRALKSIKKSVKRSSKKKKSGKKKRRARKR